MKPTNLKHLLMLLLALTLFQACNTDDDSTEIIVAESPVLITQVISEWNELWLELDRFATGMRPNATARSLAYIHLAAYETAVYSINGFTSNTNRLETLNIDETQRAININLSIALNSCYAKVIDHFMYNIPSNIDDKIQELKTSKIDELEVNVSNQIVQDSREWGNYVADRIIAYSQTDTEGEEQILEPQPLSYVPSTGDGFWTFSAEPERALFPYWGSVRTFVISSDQTSSIAPPIAYSEDVNSDYYAEMYEVYEMNNIAKAENNDDLWVAEFWSDDTEGLVMSPPGRQISIAKQLIEQNDLAYESSLVLLLKLGFSLNDAAVSTWADKYEYMVMRPSAYLHEFVDPDYETNLFRLINWLNPSFPGYPSGHSTFSSAAAGIFIAEFGNNTNFTDRSHEGRIEFRGEPRQFNTLADMAEENAFSRIPLGVHIRMDCTEGLRLGYEISDAVNDLDLSTSN